MSRARTPVIVVTLANARAGGPAIPGSAVNRLPPSGCGERAVVMNMRRPSSPPNAHAVTLSAGTCEDGVERAAGPVAADLGAAVERDPDAVLDVEREAVGHADARPR